MYTRESFATGLHRDMGHLSVHVRHAHLFLDGLYWGVYQIQERPDAKFHASWLGGDADDYDALNSGVVTDGEDSAWLELFDRARLDLTDDAHYRSVEALLELDAFIDYMVLNQYLGNRDWPVKNYWVARNRAEDGPFHFRVWDAELIQSVSTDNIIDVTAEGSPGELFQALRTHPEFRLRVADRVQAHFFPGGGRLHRHPLPHRARIHRRHHLEGAGAGCRYMVTGRGARLHHGAVNHPLTDRRAGHCR
jgi:hypothetical protein